MVSDNNLNWIESNMLSLSEVYLAIATAKEDKEKSPSYLCAILQKTLENGSLKYISLPITTIENKKNLKILLKDRNIQQLSGQELEELREKIKSSRLNFELLKKGELEESFNKKEVSLPIKPKSFGDLSKKELTNLVNELICNPYWKPENPNNIIKEFGIDINLKNIVEIVKVIAQKDGMAISKSIQTYGISTTTPEGQLALIEIAKHVAQQGEYDISECIQNYGINAASPEGQQALIEIAKLTAKKKGAKISKYIQNYGINATSPEGQQALIEIAKLAVQQEAFASEHIRNYGINADIPTGQQALIEIAKLVAQNSTFISAFIQNYGINANSPEGQRALIEIAKLAAQRDGKITSAYIKKYGINAATPEGQQALIEISILAAKNGGGGTSYYIQNYCINAASPIGLQGLIEVAKLDAQLDGRAISENIQNFGINAVSPEGKQALIEIAKLAAQQNGREISKNIQNFGINAENQEGQRALIEIAKLAAQQSGEGISLFIRNYGINADTAEGQQGLIEIAKLAAQQNGWKTSEYIQNYGINVASPEGQQGLIEIAKLAAQQDGYATSLYIQRYGINAASSEGQLGLIEIAKLAAQRDGGATSLYIQRYGINAASSEGQQALIEIAKLAAQQNGGKTSEYIQNYGINAASPEGQRGLIEIAKQAARQNGEGTSLCIRKYGINVKTPEGQQAFIKIAKLAAQNDGKGTSTFINYYYGINSATPEGQQALVEIAKLAAQNNGEGTSEHILGYGIKEFTPEGQQALVEIAKLAAQQNGLKTSEFIAKFMIKDPKHRLEIFLEAFRQNTDSLFLFGRFDLPQDWVGLNIIKEENINKKIQKLQEFYPFIKDERLYHWGIYALGLSYLYPEIVQDSYVKNSSLLEITAKYPDPKMKLELLSLIPKVFPKKCELYKQLISGSREHMKLIALFLCARIKSEKFLKLRPFLELKPLMNTNRIFKDGINLKILLDTLSTLKKRKFAYTFLVKALKEPSKDKILEKLCAIQGIVLCNGNLQDILEIGFDSALLNAFKTLFPLIKEIPNFSSRWLKAGLGSNLPSLLIYASRIKSIPQVNTLFYSYIVSLLEGNFKECRYDTQYSVHLKELFENNQGLKDHWMKNSRKDLILDPTDATGTRNSQKNFNFTDFLKTKILTDRHWTECPYLVNFLQTGKENPELTKKINEEVAKPHSPELPKLELQVQLIGLVKSSAKEKITLDKLKAIDELVRQVGGEFANDMNVLMKSFEAKPLKSNLEIVNTDDPIDLLMCGTHLGTCQRVDGQANFNKCLVSYLLDGKIRLIAIKDKVTGKIVARAILSLFFEGDKPALMLDRIYHNDLTQNLKNALENYAIDIAKALNLTIYHKGQERTEITLVSKGGRAPWEYVDSAGGIMENSVYKIFSVEKLLKAIM